MTAILQTERLALRPWSFADIEAAFALYRDPDVTRFLGEPLQNIAAAREIVSRTIEHYEAFGFGQWALVETASSDIVGACGLKLLDGGPDIEITYHLARRVWGRGYATEAARACLDYGFKRCGFERVLGIADPANVASHRVLEKIGMTPMGMGRYYNRDVKVWSKSR